MSMFRLREFERLRGHYPDWCIGIEEDQLSGRWCFETGTLLAIAIAASAAGTALSVVGSIQQGKAAQQQANYQAAVARQQAERERLIAASNEKDFRRQQSFLMAKRRAAMGASGVEATTGSPLLVSEDFAGETELQALRIRNTGEVGYTRLQQQAGLYELSGANARRAGYFRAGSALLSGIGQGALYGGLRGGSSGYSGGAFASDGFTSYGGYSPYG